MTAMIESINQEAWGEWVDWRRKEKKRPITPTSERLQHRLLAGYTHEQQRLILEHSMRQGYQGLFPDDVVRQQPAKTSTRANSLEHDLNDRSWAM